VFKVNEYTEKCKCGGNTDVITTRTKSIHDMRCKKCGREFKEDAWDIEVYKIKCSCGGDTEEIPKLSQRTSTLHIWKPYWEENITHQPVLVESKQHLKDLCKKHDVVAHRLD
jgi:hypothetical protein